MGDADLQLPGGVGELDDGAVGRAGRAVLEGFLEAPEEAGAVLPGSHCRHVDAAREDRGLVHGKVGLELSHYLLAQLPEGQVKAPGGSCTCRSPGISPLPCKHGGAALTPSRSLPGNSGLCRPIHHPPRPEAMATMQGGSPKQLGTNGKGLCWLAAALEAKRDRWGADGPPFFLTAASPALRSSTLSLW